MEQVGNRIDHRRATIIGTIAAIHFMLFIVVFFASMGSSMSRFDSGEPANLTDSLLDGAFQILSFPLFKGLVLLNIRIPGVWGWLPFLANSVLWGWVGWRVIRFRRSRRGGATGDGSIISG